MINIKNKKLMKSFIFKRLTSIFFTEKNQQNLLFLEINIIFFVKNKKINEISYY